MGAQRHLSRALTLQDGAGDNAVSASLLHNLGGSALPRGLGVVSPGHCDVRASVRAHSAYLAESLGAYAGFLRAAKRSAEALQARKRADAIRALRTH